MAKYYYNKYNVNNNYQYRISWMYLDVASFMWSPCSFVTINPTSGVISTSSCRGSTEKVDAYEDSTGTTAYNMSGSNVIRGVVKGSGKLERHTGSPERYLASQTRGSLVESNIIAEDGTYPANGQSGGYWWVRGSAVPLPTVPSSITIPTEIKGGESFTVSWGASSYQTGYRLERQLNGGSWVQIVQQAGTSYVDTVDKGTLTVNYRVLSYGNGGTSGYRTGTARSVINFPEIFENYNGTFVAYEGAWENVNGTWVEIDSVWENVNGVWVEL